VLIAMRGDLLTAESMEPKLQLMFREHSKHFCWCLCICKIFTL